MGKSKKDQDKQKSKYMLGNDKILEVKTYEDFNEEKPLPDDPNLKEPNVENANSGSIKMYTCPMHPEVISTKPGTCSMCGMKLVVKE